MDMHKGAPKMNYILSNIFEAFGADGFLASPRFLISMFLPSQRHVSFANTFPIQRGHQHYMNGKASPLAQRAQDLMKCNVSV